MDELKRSASGAPENPFPGLRAFEPREADLFFGRDAQVEALLARLASNRFLAIAGAERSGKSSLLQAGILPSLWRGFRTSRGSKWRVAVMVPGAEPIANLARALHQPNALGTRSLDNDTGQALVETTLNRGSLGLVEAVGEAWLEPDENFIVIVDQFEELFSGEKGNGKGAQPAEESAAFIKLLLSAAHETDIPIFVLIALRSNSISDCSRFPSLAEALSQGMYLLPRMTRMQIQQAIQGPIAAAGASITPRLVQRVLNDSTDESDQLATLQIALMRTWEAWEEAGERDASIDIPHYEARAQQADEHSKAAVGTIEHPPVGAGSNGTAATGIRPLEAPAAVADGKNEAAAARIAYEPRVQEPHRSAFQRTPAISNWVRPSVALAAGVIFAAGIIMLRISHRTAAEQVAHHLATQSTIIATDDPDQLERSALLAIESVRRAPSFESEMVLRRAAALLRRVRFSAPMEGRATAVTYDPHGRFVAVAGADKTARILDAASGRESHRFITEGTIAAIALGADGKYLVTGGDDRTGRVFEIASGREVARVLLGGPINAVAITPDGRYFAAGSDDGTARVYETSGGNSISTMKPKAKVRSIAFSADGAYLAVGSDDSSVRVFEAGSGTQLWKHDHRGPVNHVSFSSDGKTVLSASSDGTAALLDADTGKERAVIDAASPVNSAAFSSDGHLVATGSDDGSVRVFKLQPATEIGRLVHQGPIHQVVFNPEGSAVASASADGTARILDLAGSRESARIYRRGGVNSIAFGPHGQALAVAGEDKSMALYDLRSGNDIAMLTPGDAFTRMTFSADGHYAITANSDDTASLFDVWAGKDLPTVNADSPVSAVALSARGDSAAVGCDDGITRILRTRDGFRKLRLQQAGGVSAAAFSGDGRYVATGSRSGLVHIFDAHSGAEVSQVIAHGKVNALAFSADGERLGMVDDQGAPAVFETATVRKLAKLGHPANGEMVAFSGDGETAAIAGPGKLAGIFDASSGKEIAPLPLNRRVFAVAFSADAKIVAASGADSSVYLFDAQNGLELSKLSLDGHVDAIAFNGNNQRLQVASNAHSSDEVPDVIVREYPAAAADLINDVCSRLSRNLTRAEWAQYLGKEPYHKTCANLL